MLKNDNKIETNITQVQDLKRCVENSLDKQILTPKDFDFLSGVIWERTNEVVSTTTLKRLWGYIKGYPTAHRRTLDVLSMMVGFCSWDDYINNHIGGGEEESAVILSNSIRTEELNIGDSVDVRWRPDRHCIFRYIGDENFVVEESENSKLKSGDKFKCFVFVKGCALYMDELERDGKRLSSYVAGKSGLISVKLI